MIDLPPVDPVAPLRVLNAVASLLVAPMLWRIVWRSPHQHRAPYRLGMLAIMAGLILTAAGLLPIVPRGAEVGLLYLGVYLAVIAIWLDVRHRDPPG